MTHEDLIKELLEACADALNMKCTSIERILAKIALEAITDRDRAREALKKWQAYAVDRRKMGCAIYDFKQPAFIECEEEARKALEETHG